VLAGTQYNDCLAGEGAEEMGGDFDPRLSTAFAKGGGLLPTAIYGSSQT